MRRLAAVIAVLTIAVLAAPPPAPAHLSYVTSDSMAPTMTADDGYVVASVTEPEPGDVIVFESDVEEGYVTHRVVDETPDGYVTKGDANPATDQATGAPPVTDERVLGTVLAVGGRPLVVPGLGTAAAALSAVPIPLLGAAAAVLLLPLGSGAAPDREVMIAREVLVPALVGAAVAAFLVLSAAPTTHDLGYTAVEYDSPAADAVPVDEPATDEVELATATPPLTHLVVEGHGVDVERLERTDAGVRLGVTVPAQSEAGRYTATVETVPYPATLPRSTVTTLHGIHPVAARLATVLAGLLPVAGLAALAVDGRSRVRTGESRLLRRWSRP